MSRNATSRRLVPRPTQGAKRKPGIWGERCGFANHRRFASGGQVQIEFQQLLVEYRYQPFRLHQTLFGKRVEGLIFTLETC